MHRATWTIALLTLLLACGAPSGPKAPSSIAPSAATTQSALPEREPDGTDGDVPTGEANEAPAVESNAPSTRGLPSQDALESKPSLRAPWPEIEAVTAELGKPAFAGTVQRLHFRFDPRQRGETFSCDSLDVLRLPSGAAVLGGSVHTANECKGVKGTTAKLREALVTLGAQPQDGLAGLGWMVDEVTGKPFDAVVAALEKALGKPAERGEVPLAGWRYLGTDETCKLLLITNQPASDRGLAIWGVPCA